MAGSSKAGGRLLAWFALPGRTRIGVRLGLGLAMLTGLLLVLILTSILNLNRATQRIHQILEVSNAKVWHANAIRDAAQTTEGALLLVALAPPGGSRPLTSVRVLSAWAALRHSLQELQSLETSTRGAELLTRLRQAMETAGDPAQWGLGAPRTRETADALVERIRTLHPSLLQLRELCGELVAYEREQADRLYQEARESYRFTRNASVILAFVVIGVAVLMGVRLTRSITRPLREGVQIAGRLAEGDLAVHIQATARDETGELLAALKHMAERLRESKRLEAQLQQAQKLETVGQLAGGIAHDFNNILTVINGQAQIGLLAVRHEPRLQKHFAAIEQAADRAAALTRQLLAFSRTQVLEVRTLDLNAIVRNLQKMLGRLIGEHIEMVTECAEDLGSVRADPVQIEQILLNLAVNARDAMPSGGRLTIATRSVDLDETYAKQHAGVIPGRYAMLAVTDTGVGMPPEVRDRAFEPFFTTKPKGRGTGLGLATVYGIVKQSQGHVALYSEPNLGTTVTVYLPRVDGATPAAESRMATGDLPRGHEVVLLTEDDAAVRAFVRSALEHCGYTVLEAANGQAALELHASRRDPIHLLLTDMVMPGFSGLQLAQTLVPRAPGLKLLFMSGYLEHSLAGDLGLGSVPVHFIQKPFAIAELTRRVREALDDRQATLGSTAANRGDETPASVVVGTPSD